LGSQYNDGNRKGGERVRAERANQLPAPDERAIKTQLARILGSPSFSKSERLKTFLTFVVTESLRGEGDSLKESVLARELYGKGQDFDTAADPAVRIDARRLRDKLREYYSEFGSDPVLVSVPKGTYSPVFEWNPDTPHSVVAQMPLRLDPRPVSKPSTYQRKRYFVGAGICALGLAGASMWLMRSGQPGPAPVLMPLTALPGSEGPPSFSPDGQLVAFDWTGTGKPATSHIYVKEVHGEALRQLTEGTGEHNPAWSPDGSRIAFTRRQGVYIISQIGGAEQQISDTGTHVGWTQDSKSLLIRALTGPQKPFGIFQVSLETRTRRQITQPTRGIGDTVFSVSPDGKTLAFARYGIPGVGDIFVVPISGGEPRRLTNWSAGGMSVAWTPDGRDVVYTVTEPQGGRIWRIPWKTGRPERGTPLTSQTGDAVSVSVAPPLANRLTRLAYQVRYADIGLRLVDLTAVSDGVFTSVEHLADSTRVQTVARFSPDASRVIFASNRSGIKEVWVSNRDGSDLRQLTSFNGPNTLPGDWSPDGRMLLIQASVNGNSDSDVYTIPAIGGNPQRMTTDPNFHMAPSWSADGKWIYFGATPDPASHDEHRSQIWRMPAEGGKATQITHDGGFFPQESLDGKFLYYLDRPRNSAFDPGNIMRIRVAGGAPATVLEGKPGELWSLTQKGIFFVTRDRADTINLLPLEDGATARPVGTLPFRISGYGGSMTVSKDGRWLITNETNRLDTDLMLIENFK
jgi:Tol biopolymer transport system component